jgi:hypothetical protein
MSVSLNVVSVFYSDLFVQKAYHQYGVGSRLALYITKKVHSTRSRK